MKLKALPITLIAVLLLAGCAIVSSHDYVHSGTEQLRKSFYWGGEEIDREALIEMDDSGVLFIPDIRLSKDGRTLQGALHVITRDEQIVHIEQVQIRAENADFAEIRIVSMVTAPKAARGGLWVARVELRPGFDDPSVTAASTVVMSLTWSDPGLGKVMTTRLVLEKISRRSVAWVT